MTHPRVLGYDFSNWTARLARHHVRVQFNKDVSARTVLRVFRRQGLVLLRPRPVPALADTRRQQRFFDSFRRRIQRPQRGHHFLFYDACSVQRAATVTRMWWARGSQPTVLMQGQSEHLHVLGALDATANNGYFMFTKKLDSAHFCAFLRRLMAQYPREKLHIVVDNASPHWAMKTRECVAALAPHLELIFLPPYSPKLNPIEKFWALLRRQVTHNTHFSSFVRFRLDVARFLFRFMKPMKRIENLCRIYYRKGPFSVSKL